MTPEQSTPLENRRKAIIDIRKRLLVRYGIEQSEPFKAVYILTGIQAAEDIKWEEIRALGTHSSDPLANVQLLSVEISSKAQLTKGILTPLIDAVTNNTAAAIPLGIPDPLSATDRQSFMEILPLTLDTTVVEVASKEQDAQEKGWFDARRDILVAMLPRDATASPDYIQVAKQTILNGDIAELVQPTLFEGVSIKYLYRQVGVRREERSLISQEIIVTSIV